MRPKGRRAKEDYCVKFITIGDQNVGKTSVMNRYFDNQFQANNLATIGVAQKFKVVSILNKSVKLQVYDTAGQERFRTLTHGYYNNANGVILMYDVTREESFDNTTNWLR